METRGGDRLPDVHAEHEYVQDGLKYRIGDPSSTARAQDKARLSVPHDNRRGHRGKWTFARRDGVGFALDETEHIRLAGLRGEIVHLVVQEEAGSLDGHTVSVTTIQGVSVGYSVAFAVHDREMRSLGGFERCRLAGL